MLEMLILISAPKTESVRVDHPAHDTDSSGKKKHTVLRALSHIMQLLCRSALSNKADHGLSAAKHPVLRAERDSAGAKSP